MEVRYMIWNNVAKEFQFPNIFEKTEKGANTCLFNAIGNDARKWRFEIKKVEINEGQKIRQELKDKYKARRIKEELWYIPFSEILQSVIRNRELEKKNNANRF